MNRLFMQRLFIIFLLCARTVQIESAPSRAKNSMTLSVSSQQYQKMPLLIGIVQEDDELNQLAQLVKKMLDRTNQRTSGFAVSMRALEKTPSKKEITRLAREGFPLIVFISRAKQSKGFEWRLYDAQPARMVKGKQFAANEYGVRAYAEHMADQLWPLLTAQEGVFSTRIAYCKEEIVPGKLPKKAICCAPLYLDASKDAVNQFEQVLVDRGMVFAPRWNNDIHDPLVLYSQTTRSNVCLMAVDLNGGRRMVSNFDGVNMLPSFSPDGKQVVFCKSDGGKSKLYAYQKNPETGQPVLECLTDNGGNNVSPSVCEDGDVIFCSDAYSRAPQICHYHALTKQVEKLTSGGYCAAPSYCPKNKKIAYTKLVNGWMQIMVYDPATKEHTQLTSDRGNKQECSWSPCGSYVAFSVEEGVKSRIAVLNLQTDERSYLTPPGMRCRFPSWSPRYEIPLLAMK